MKAAAKFNKAIIFHSNKYNTHKQFYMYCCFFFCNFAFAVGFHNKATI